MFYQFSNLKLLYRDMIIKKETRCIFTIKYNGKPFSCIFIIDIKPFRLYLDTVGKEPYSFEFEILEKFRVAPYINKDDYYNLIHYLGLKWQKGNPFTPASFFQSVDMLIPSTFTNKPKYHAVLKVISRHREIEESEKIYFCGWRNNNERERVSERNLEKTKSVFGDDRAKMCKRLNISSRWTDIPELEQLEQFYSSFERSMP